MPIKIVIAGIGHVGLLNGILSAQQNEAIVKDSISEKEEMHNIRGGK